VKISNRISDSLSGGARRMKYRIDERDYWLAIDKAFDFIREKKGSSAAQAFSSLIANVWDPIVSANVGDILASLDSRNQELGLDLIIGRTQHGRPIRHRSWEQIERISIDQFNKKKMVPEID
jgi:hypothetical protein